LWDFHIRRISEFGLLARKLKVALKRGRAVRLFFIQPEKESPCAEENWEKDAEGFHLNKLCYAYGSHSFVDNSPSLGNVPSGWGNGALFGRGPWAGVESEHGRDCSFVEDRNIRSCF
jgi:hypothetical protein